MSLHFACLQDAHMLVITEAQLYLVMALFRSLRDHSLVERANLYLLPVPKAEEMNRRLGNLVEEFKQLVYPPDYNPDGKAVKRKQGK